MFCVVLSWFFYVFSAVVSQVAGGLPLQVEDLVITIPFDEDFFESYSSLINLVYSVGTILCTIHLFSISS